MRKLLCLAVWVVGLTVVAGCSTDPSASADTEGERASLATSSENTLNSPTAGPTSSGLSGGTEASDPPELDPDRGTKLH